jgi:prophage regulatory protein
LASTKEILALLAISRTTIGRLRAKDPTSPKPIKDGDARTARTYYVLAEIEAWVQRRMDQRDGDLKPEA